MQWTAADGAGFSTGLPWLPVARDAATRDVAAEVRDPASLHAWYAALLRLRRNDPAVRSGGYVALASGDPHVVAFGRREGNGGIVVVLNMSDVPRAVSLDGWTGSPTYGAAVLKSAAEAPLAGGGTTIGAWGTLVQRVRFGR